MPVSRANGLDIYYEKAGSGPPLVLIHALPFDHNLWLYQVQRFSAHFTTLAMDLRGWGRSAKPHTPFSLADMGNDILGVLKDEGVSGGAVVLGCSIGSKLALMLACDRPDIFSAAILVGGNSDTAIGRYLLNGFVERDDALDADSIAQVFGALTVSDLTDRLPAYKSPTLIVNGEFDNALKGGTRTASLIAQAEHTIIPGTGHCCFLEDPGSFDVLVSDFLKRNRLWPQ